MTTSPTEKVPTRRVFTDRFLRSLAPGRTPKDYSDLQQRGLIAWLLPSGTIQFVVRYRWQGKNRRFKLGTYSDQFTIAKARVAARAAIVKVEAGKDPAGAHQTAKRATTGDTVADLATCYLDKHAKAHKRSWKDDARMLNAEVLPKWKTRKVADLTRRDVRDLVDAIAERGAPLTANRCLALIRKMLNFGIQQDWIESNVASLIQKPGAEVSRDRVLTDDEIRKLWRCLTNLPATEQLPAPFRKRERGPKEDPLCPVSPRQADILMLRLLTAQRGGEVARMRWQDLDLTDDAIGWWTIPAEHAKNGRAHRVPLVGRALEIVKARQVIQTDDLTDAPAENDENDPPVFVFTDGETGAQDRAKKAPGVLAKVTGIDFRGHDLRRTAATKMAEAGIPHTDIGKVLNHAEGGPRATAVYNRYQADREKRIALDTWDRTLTGILDKTPASNVTPMTRRKGA